MDILSLHEAKICGGEVVVRKNRNREKLLSSIDIPLQVKFMISEN